MSDFFSNLVSRARGTAPTIRPNVASYFEPPRLPPLVASSNVDAEIERSRTASAPPTMPEPQGPRRMQPAAAPSDPDTHVPQPPAAPSAGVQRSPLSNGPSLPAQPTEPMDTASHVQKISQPISVARRSEAEAPVPGIPEPPTGVPLVHGVGKAAPDVAENFSEDEPDKMSQPTERLVEAISVPTSAGFVEPTPVAPKPIVPRYLSEAPLRGGESEVRSRTSSAAPLEDAPPPILVTIGRLEIRAVTSATPVSIERPDASRPRMSLDDYLRRRNGGGP